MPFTPTRRQLIASVPAATMAVRTPSLFAASKGHSTFRNGLCATTYAEPILAKGIAFDDGPRVATTMLELQKLMMRRGSNEVFVRLGSTRASVSRAPDGYAALARRRALLARQVGLPLNPELTLSARYGDVGGQPEPDFTGYPEIKLSKPWHQLEIGAMCDAMRAYGRIVAREIHATGARVNVWDIGNEVEFGIAGVAIQPMNKAIGGPDWAYRAPDAVDPEIGKMSFGKFFLMKSADQVDWAQTHLWSYVGNILAAVAEGIREVDRRARFATHTSAIAAVMPAVFVGFNEAVDAAGFHADSCGTSYYPTNTRLIPNRLERFKEAARLTMQRLRRPVYIAEFGYAAGPVVYGGNDWANPVEGYPCTPDGQADFLRDLVAWGVGEKLLSGVRPWAPDYVGGSWQGMALFDAPLGDVAFAREGLAAIQQGLKIANGRRSLR